MLRSFSCRGGGDRNSISTLQLGPRKRTIGFDRIGVDTGSSADTGDNRVIVVTILIAQLRTLTLLSAPTNAIKLAAALEKFVASQVREGTYRSREAAIVAAVSHQKRRSEQLAWLQSEVLKGLDSGPAVEFDIEKVIRRGRRRLAAHACRARS